MQNQPIPFGSASVRMMPRPSSKELEKYRFHTQSFHRIRLINGILSALIAPRRHERDAFFDSPLPDYTAE